MKKLILAVMLVVLTVCLCACNKQIIDTTYRFDKAQIMLPDGTIVSGNVQSWKDFEDGEQLQIKIDGITYLVHSENVVMIND